MRPEIKRARELRRDMSEPERILWSRLRLLREQGFKIRRQRPFEGYFLDFVCLSRLVVIEVDGSQHGDDLQADHDLVRDRLLRRHGFTVLRFWAGEMRGNLGGVMERIVEALEAAPSGADGMEEEAGRWLAPSLGHTAPP